MTRISFPDKAKKRRQGEMLNVNTAWKKKKWKIDGKKPVKKPSKG